MNSAKQLTVQVPIVTVAKEKMTGRRLGVFVIGNAFVVLFFFGFWLLGWWMQSLEDLWHDFLPYLPALWFVSFFIVSFISLNGFRKWLAALMSLGFALSFSILLYYFLMVCYLVLAPFLDPMF